MNVVIINSQGFWSMGWATSPSSQQDVIQSLQRGGVNVSVFEVGSKAQLLNVLGALSCKDCLIWPNAYEVAEFEGSKTGLWLADIIDEQGFPMIGCSAAALKTVLLKDVCQGALDRANVSIPKFAKVTSAETDDLDAILQEKDLVFPLFTKPNGLSSSKGITQDCVVRDINKLRQQILLLGSEFGYPVMVEEYLPGQDITAAVFMSPNGPIILATYYDTQIYADPGAVLDCDIRQLDWNDGKWLRVVIEPKVLIELNNIAISVCDTLNINQFTRIDCRFDRNGTLKVFDVNGLPGLELPFSTTVWQMIVKQQGQPHHIAFDILISLIIYCAANRHHVKLPAHMLNLAEGYIAENPLVVETVDTHLNTKIEVHQIAN